MKRFRFPAFTEQTGEALRLAFLQGLFWAAMAIGGYQTVYLQEIGFPASQFGLLNAIACVVAILSMTFWGSLSDRIGSVRRVAIVTLIVGPTLYALLPFLPTGLPYSALLFLIYIPFINFFRAPTSTFVENLTVRSCTERRLHYGMVRSTGSLLFAVGGVLVARWIVPAAGVASTFWISGLAMIPPIILMACCAEPQTAPRAKRSRAGSGELLKNRSFLILLFFAVFYYAAIAFEGNFLPYLMADAGIDGTNYGILTAIRGVMEIPCLLFVGKLRQRIPSKVLMMAAPCLMGLECLLLGLFADSLLAFALIVALYGLGNGIFIGTAFGYIYDLAPVHLRATAHGLFVSVQQVSGILGNLLGGVLFDSIGGKPFYLAASGLMFLSVLIFFLGSRGKPANEAA